MNGGGVGRNGSLQGISTETWGEGLRKMGSSESLSICRLLQDLLHPWMHLDHEVLMHPPAGGWGHTSLTWYL